MQLRKTESYLTRGEIMQTIKEIDKYKNNIHEYGNDINKLESNVNDVKNELASKNKEYQDLVINGKVEQADKLYSEIEKLEADYRVKNKRLTVMKRSLKQVVIKNCESMTQVADRLRDEYINVYHDDLNNYEQLKQELQEAENKLKAHNNEYYTKQRELSRYIDGKRRENDIQNIEFMGAVNIIEPFNV